MSRVPRSRPTLCEVTHECHYAPRSHCLQLVGIRTHYSLQTQLRGTYYQRRINSGPRRLITRERFGLGLDHGRSAWLLVSGQPAGHCWRSRRVSGDVTCRQCDRSQCRAPVCMAFPPLPRHLLPRPGPPAALMKQVESRNLCADCGSVIDGPRSTDV